MFVCALLIRECAFDNRHQACVSNFDFGSGVVGADKRISNTYRLSPQFTAAIVQFWNGFDQEAGPTSEPLQKIGVALSKTVVCTAFDKKSSSMAEMTGEFVIHFEQARFGESFNSQALCKPAGNGLDVALLVAQDDAKPIIHRRDLSCVAGQAHAT